MKKITIIGAGTMGNGIAHTFAQKDFKVSIVDISDDNLQKAVATISKNLDRMVAKEKITSEEKIKTLKKNINKLKDLSGYDLKILCLGRSSKIYQNIIDKRSLDKDYKEVAITGYVKHSIKNLNAAQYFLKDGPLAILPFSKSSFL